MTYWKKLHPEFEAAVEELIAAEANASQNFGLEAIKRAYEAKQKVLTMYDLARRTEIGTEEEFQELIAGKKDAADFNS
jgi:hypothetical protein